MDEAAKQYDVALSFAGEQRDYVRQVAARLEAAGVQVFFDEFKAIELWGQDLAVHFDSVYRKQARFVVPFISADYVRKAWPRHEFQSALAQAVEATNPYILPVRFDSTEVPGLRPTISYLHASQVGPEGVANAILARLGKESSTEPVTAQVVPRMPSVPPSNFNPYAEGERAVTTLRTELGNRSAALEAQGFGVHFQDRNGRSIFRVMRSGRTLYSLDVWIGGDWGDNTICFSAGAGERMSSNGTNAHGTIEWDRKRGLPVIQLANLSLLRDMGHEYRLTPGELVEEIWQEVCRVLEDER